MCRARRRIRGATAFLAFGCVATALAGPAGAQETAPAFAPGVSSRTEAELLARLDSLLPLLDEAREEVERLEAAREAERRAGLPALDSLVVGPTLVVTWPDQVERAREVMGRAWETFDRVGMPADRFRETVVFQWSEELRPLDVGHWATRVEMESRRGMDVAVARAAVAIGNAFARELQGTPVGDWNTGAVMPGRTLEGVYRNLVTTPSATNRACLDGDAGACWTSLGLDLDVNPMDEWYSGPERVDRVRWHLGPEGPRMTETARACRAGDGLACDAFVEARPDWFARSSAPLGYPEARRHLLWVALEAGGEGAFARLTEDPEMAPGDALRYASGLDAEELAARWRADVIASRPRPANEPDLSWLTTPLWLLAFAGLASRSTRCRMG